MKIRTINNHCTAVYIPVNYGVKLEVTVFSYDTPVVKIDGNNTIYRLWDDWSITTQRDINKVFKGLNMNKKLWEKLRFHPMTIEEIREA